MNRISAQTCVYRPKVSSSVCGRETSPAQDIHGSVLLELQANNDTAVVGLSLKLCKPVNRKYGHKRKGCRQRSAVIR